MSAFGVFYVAPGQLARDATLWAVTLDAPKGTTVATAAERFGNYRGWQGWAGSVPAGGKLSVRKLPPGMGNGTGIPWSDLAPETRRLSVDVSGELWAAVARAARAEGLTQSAYVAAVLERAVTS